MQLEGAIKTIKKGKNLTKRELTYIKNNLGG